MASVGPSHLTVEQVCNDSNFEESGSDIEVHVIICNFVHCLGTTFCVVVVSERPLSGIL